ncbi:putative efflux protein, MATE family [Nocardioides scoriae]|uniref:Probable multidrug resistance protein NorM n=1 Tax=Nocardioides scoriae TaxID=642780 RepID=A0A1H1VWF9_9ACTN|nr:MATE family efflux transporter [Nocardioides scoriae]SDS88821.1 putative efflux protein, MATE family [Nocardioides scoriae]
MTQQDRAQRRAHDRVQDRAQDREILRLAVPAFLALVAEPMFLLADAAIVGHLGTPELAALGIASAVLGTLVSLCIFLAYGTTASVARQVGAGRGREALAQGVDGLWLATGLGVVATVVTVALTRPIVRLFGPGQGVEDQAVVYLRIALLGAVPLLLMLAATGVLRGLQDTRTPLVVAVAANAANVVLNLVLVYGVGSWAGMGLAGSALGTLVAQLGAAVALVAVVVRAARHEQASLAPDLSGIRRAGRAGVPLILRTLMLRASLLVMTYAAARLGEADLATMQLALTIWTFLAFTLDAVAIAAQAITGRHLGAGDAARTRAVTRRMQRWGWASGVVTGLALAALAPVLGGAFTSDPAVLDLLVPVLLVAALAQPLAGIVFVLDGVLIGAGDAVYLAWAQLVTLVVFAPAALLLGDRGLTWLWATFGVAFMGGRAVTLVLRARGDRWLRLGA